jgi:hypothetical protein
MAREPYLVALFLTHWHIATDPSLSKKGYYISVTLPYTHIALRSLIGGLSLIERG